MRAIVCLPFCVCACAGDDRSEKRDTGSATPFLEASCDPTANALRFACAVDVNPPQAVTVEVVEQEARGYAPPPFVSPAAQAHHDVPVYYLHPESTYDVTITAADPSLVVTATIQSGVPHEAAQSSLTVIGASSSPLMGTDSPCNRLAIAVIYDTLTGELVWYQNLDLDGEISFDNMLRFTANQTVIADTAGRVVEMDLAGNVLVDFPQPEGIEFNHDINVHEDLIYVLAKDALANGYYENGLILDGVALMDRDGIEVARWYAGDTLPIADDAEGNWLHANSVSVDDNGDMYLNFLEQDTIAKLSGDPATFGETLWLLSGGEKPSSIGVDFTIDWSQIDGPDFLEFAHWFNQRRDGRWTILDNNHGRLLILSVDQQALTAVAEATFEAPQIDCDGQGTATETLNGNPVVACSEGPVREYDLVTGEGLWEAAPVCPEKDIVVANVRWYPIDSWFTPR